MCYSEILNMGLGFGLLCCCAVICLTIGAVLVIEQICLAWTRAQGITIPACGNPGHHKSEDTNP